QYQGVLDLPQILNSIVGTPAGSDRDRRENQIVRDRERYHVWITRHEIAPRRPGVLDVWTATEAVVVVDAVVIADVRRELVQHAVADRPAMLSDSVPISIGFELRARQVVALKFPAVGGNVLLAGKARDQRVIPAELDVRLGRVQRIPIRFVYRVRDLCAEGDEELQFVVHVVRHGDARVLADSFARYEEESPIAQDRTAHGPA